MLTVATGRGWISLVATIVVLAVSGYLTGNESTWSSLWPSLAALGTVLISRSALFGLLIGAVCGAHLLAGTEFTMEVIPEAYGKRSPTPAR